MPSEIAPLTEKARACPHDARSLDWCNPCPCGIRWQYDENIAAWRPYSLASA